jgi:hypothetical protein
MATQLNVPAPAPIPDELANRLVLAVRTLQRVNATYADDEINVPHVQARLNVRDVADRLGNWLDKHDSALDAEWLTADTITQQATENGVVLSLHLTHEITQSRLDDAYIVIPD